MPSDLSVRPEGFGNGRERSVIEGEAGRSLFAAECVATKGDGIYTPDASALHRVQLGMLEALGQGITVVLEIGSGAALPSRSSWHLEVLACDSMTPQQGQSARAAILAAVEDPRVGFTFQQHVGTAHASAPAEFSVSLRPAVQRLDKADGHRLIGFHAQAAAHSAALIPRLPPHRGGEMDALLRTLALADAPIRVRCTLRRVALSTTLLRRLSTSVGRLSSPVASWLEAARENPSSIELDATLLSDVPIDPDLVARAGRSLFGTSPLSGDPARGGADALYLGFHEDLWVPMLLPSPKHLNAQGIPAVVIPRSLALSEDGLVLGQIPGSAGRLVRLPEQDRSRHLYAIGGSGSGKSTLLLRMLEADMHAGHGVCLIDPHGDLFEEAIRRVPASRAHDVVIIDPYDEEFSVGLNMLESCGTRPDIAPTVVSNSLMAIFDRLYDLEKAGGPIFETYLRNAVLLVLAGDLSATVVDVVRVFEDSSYRKCLIDLCSDESVTRFWTEQAHKAGGDASLRNVAPYVTSKLNQFTNNHLIRPIVGQSTSTIRFDTILKAKQIVLVNLAIGQLGALDSRFLGMLLLDKIFEAAVSFVGERRSHRQPFTIYLDEFHDFAGSKLEAMLSAGRKFGLRLVLAHQTLSQLTSSRHGSRLIDAVMSNTGTKLVFRVGGHDVAVLSRELGRGISAHQLQTLADFHVAATLLSGGRRGLPFVFQTLPALEPGREVATYADLRALRSRYTTPTRQTRTVSAAQSLG